MDKLDQLVRSLERKRKRELAHIASSLKREHHSLLTPEWQVKLIKSGDLLFDDFAKEHMNHVQAVARKVYVKYHEFDDKVNLSLEALYEAVYTYEDDQDVPFMAYATLKMKGKLFEIHAYHTRQRRGGKENDALLPATEVHQYVKDETALKAFDLQARVTQIVYEELTYKSEFEQFVAIRRFCDGYGISEIAHLTNHERYTIEGIQRKLKRHILKILETDIYIETKER